MLKPVATGQMLARLRHGRSDATIDGDEIDAPSFSKWILTRSVDAKYRVGFEHPHAPKFVNCMVTFVHSLVSRWGAQIRVLAVFRLRNFASVMT